MQQTKQNSEVYRNLYQIFQQDSSNMSGKSKQYTKIVGRSIRNTLNRQGEGYLHIKSVKKICFLTCHFSKISGGKVFLCGGYSSGYKSECSILGK